MMDDVSLMAYLDSPPPSSVMMMQETLLRTKRQSAKGEEMTRVNSRIPYVA